MKLRTVTAVAALGLALSSTGYAACVPTNLAQFTPPPSEGAGSVAQNRQFTPPPSEGAGSVAVACN